MVLADPRECLQNYRVEEKSSIDIYLVLVPQFQRSILNLCCRGKTLLV
jgi:hypothetical protein